MNEPNKLLDYLDFKNDDFSNIWKCINESKKSYNDINFDFPEQEENSNYIILFLNKGEQKLLFHFYKSPVNLKIEKKDYKIYTFEQCNFIFSQIDINKYSIVVNDEKVKNNSLDIEKIKTINIQKIEHTIGAEEFGKNILIEKKELPSKETIIKINKNLLSLYFNDICISSDKDDNDVDLIIDENRIEFIKKINEFLDSDDLFYQVLGADGIGKTVTLLYYSSSLLNDYGNLYLNLKLFLKYQKDKIKLKNIFYDEIKRIFLIDKNKKEFASCFLTTYNNLIKNIDNSIENNDKDGINYFWDLLFIFIEHCKKFIVNKIFIILDQYKIEQIDENFEHLNKLCNIIHSNLTKKFKLIILISINNYDTKKIFLENLNFVSFCPLSTNNIIPSPMYRSNLLEDFNIENNNTDNTNYELDDIENYLKGKQEESQNMFNIFLHRDSAKQYFKTFEMISKLDLNSKYCNITRKDYLNDIVSCKNLLNANMNINYKNCLEIFGYSLKYYSLLLSKVKNTKKENRESEDEFSKKIVMNFYAEQSNKITLNLESYYSSLYKNEPNFFEKRKENLKSLYDSIYEEKVYLLSDMKRLLEIYPIKYLNIYIVGVDSISIPLDKTDLSKFGFFFDFINPFVRETIYKYYLKESCMYNKSIQFGSRSFGVIFEELVNKKLLLLINDKRDIQQRNVFSLVGAGSKSIKNLRNKESTEFYKFYELQIFMVQIDGIDIDRVTKDIFDILNHDVYLNQLSKYGRSFDSGFLKRISKNSIRFNEFTHDLILYQNTKQKLTDLKYKRQYFKDGEKAKTFLQNIYENLKIDKIYLIFVLPYRLNTSETINLLKKEKIYYVFFNPEKNIFINKESNVVTDFCIPEAELTFKEKNFDLNLALSNINLSKKILNKSVRNFLGKKRLNDFKFCNVYNKICYENSFNFYSILIPKELKANILNKLKEDNFFKEIKSINFIPSTNCEINNISVIFDNEKILFIFSYDEKIYLYYSKYYIINDDFSIKKVDLKLNKNIKYNIKKPTKNLESFFEIKNFPLFGFGFSVIKNHIFD